MIAILAKRLSDLNWNLYRITLTQFGFPFDDDDPPHSPYDALEQLSDEKLLALADHFGETAMVQATEDIPDFWDNDRFRLFISHVHSIKAKAAQLQHALKDYQISSFVAHIDIAPTREWLAEIELALKTMDGLLALVTSDFGDSKWTDQEVGYALGRQVTVVSLSFDAPPHGFIGKHQAIRAGGASIAQMAQQVFEAFLRDDASQQRLAEPLTRRFEYSKSFRDAAKQAEYLLEFDHLPSDLLQRIEKAPFSNRQIRESWDVPDLIEALYQKHQWKPSDVPDGWTLNL